MPSHRLPSAFITAALISVFGAGALTGCPDRTVARVDPNQAKEQQKNIPVDINRNVDILFVIDNSGSMGEEQASLRANFSSFINVLRAIPGPSGEGELPNVHIGVVSTDLGGNANSAECGGTGDNGTLVGSSLVTDKYIVDFDENEDGTRETNYTGTLEDAFSDMADLGINGCGFEQPLEAMQRALNNNANAGFIRDDAFLAIIIITDEDDCSAKDNRLFDPSQDDLSTVLGPLDSFRCFEFGIQCDPDAPRDLGFKEITTCKPRLDSEYMRATKDYADFLRGFKQSEQQIIVAGIFGPITDDLLVEAKDRTNRPPAVTLAPSCMSAAGAATAGIRLQAFFNEFPTRSTTTSICNDDLSGALEQVANLLASVVGTPCLEGNIADRDPNADGIQPECSVVDVQFPDTQQEVQLGSLGECDNLGNPESSGNLPCFVIEADAECSDAPSGLKLTVYRDPNAEDRPFGTSTQIRCVAN